MPAVTPSLGHGTTIAFATGFLARLLSVSWTGISREAVAANTMNDSGGKTFLPASQYDPGELSVEMQFDTDAAPPITAAAETVTITFPDAETWAASGFLRDFQFTAGDEDVMNATAVLKFSGNITF